MFLVGPLSGAPAESRDPEPWQIRGGKFVAGWAGCRARPAETGEGGGGDVLQGCQARCLLGTLASRRVAGTGREDPQPHTNPSQLWFAVKRAVYAELRGEAESKKVPGGWRSEP